MTEFVKSNVEDSNEGMRTGLRREQALDKRINDLQEAVNHCESLLESNPLVPVYRLYSPGQGDHFYTISKEESDNAVALYGYTYEGIACYVFAKEA